MMMMMMMMMVDESVDDFLGRSKEVPFLCLVGRRQKRPAIIIFWIWMMMESSSNANHDEKNY
jgi:hypothetical protein